MEEALEKAKNDMNKYDEIIEMCKPLLDLLHKEYDPHTSIIISEGYIRIVQDKIGIALEVED